MFIQLTFKFSLVLKCLMWKPGVNQLCSGSQDFIATVLIYQVNNC